MEKMGDLSKVRYEGRESACLFFNANELDLRAPQNLANVEVQEAPGAQSTEPRRR